MRRRWLAAVLSGAATGLLPPFALDAYNIEGLAAAAAILPMHETETGVALVLLDAATEAHPSFASLPRGHWSRPLADVLDTVLDTKPAVVAIDLILPRDDRIDPAWLRSLRLAAGQNRLVLATTASSDGTGPAPSTAQIAAAGGTTALALVNLHPGIGSVIRTVAARDGPLPTLAASAAMRAGANATGRVPLAPAPPGVAAWSAAALLDCPASPALRNALEGRAVFVGAWLPHEDRHRSPFIPVLSAQRELPVAGCNGVIKVRVEDPVPGVLLHATAAQAWLRGGVRWTNPALAFATIVAAATAGAGLAPGHRLVALVIALAGFAAAAIFAFRADIVLPWLGCSVALVVSAGAWAAFERLERAWRFTAALPATYRKSPDATEVGTVTACFVDIESFTAASEALDDPAILAQELGNCLQGLAEAAERSGGFVDKYLGDGLLVLFGLDRHHSGPADAVAAVEQWFGACAGPPGLKIAGQPVRLRVGIATGLARVGALGRTDRVHFTAIGDCVNVAARLEQLNREAGTRVLADAATAAGAPQADWRDHGMRGLRGRRGRVRVFALNVRHRSL
ncbi:MAG: CHASE2 domain-containing protein [Xanthomonadaceae bacterium]|nr:CHASE2 domain-containing protein [Xanthomonadaceae bacterium]